MAPEADPNLIELSQRVLARCDSLARCTEDPGTITRGYGFPALGAAMDLVETWMRDAGLTTRRDAIGNLIGRLPTAIAHAPTLLLGSHLDSVRNAGRYDGPLGVVLALAVVEALRQSEVTLPVNLDLIAFADEEGLRFHTTYLGSRAVAGTFDPALWDRVDAQGVSLAEACRAFGGSPDAIGTAAIEGPVIGYLEAHIEQGPALEHEGIPLAVVTAIAGQTRVAVTVRGEPGHAGTVAMPLRHDALAAASAIVLAAEDLARKSDNLLATVGLLDVVDGASNVIPGRVHLTLDIRSSDDAVRHQAVVHLREVAQRAASDRGATIEWSIVQENPAVPMAPAMIRALEEAIGGRGLPVRLLASGAGHDAVAMSAACPVGMLFLRCHGGISHHPDEAIYSEDLPLAIGVLTDAVIALAKGHP